MEFRVIETVWISICQQAWSKVIGHKFSKDRKACLEGAMENLTVLVCSKQRDRLVLISVVYLEQAS